MLGSSQALDAPVVHIHRAFLCVPTCRPAQTEIYRPARSVSEPISPRSIAMAFELPPLPYDYAALEPYIDATTMQVPRHP